MEKLSVHKPEAKAGKKSFGKIFSDLSMPILLVILLIVFSILSKNFFSPTNLVNILMQNAHAAVCACGIMMIMVSGGCDLSIGYQMSVSAVLVAKLLSEGTLGVVPAMILAIVLCMALGAFNGIMGIVLKSHTMIVTLATMSIFQGISYLISGSRTYHGLPQSYMFLGQGRIFGVIPVNVVIMLVIVVIMAVIMGKTSIGRKIYAAGDNPEAARLAGLNVKKIKILVFTFAGLLVGIAAILMSARSGSADSGTSGPGIEFDGITAGVLAGVALKGGEGTLWKVIVAVYVLGELSNGMQIIGLGTYPQYIAKGLIMLLSLYMSNRNAQSM